MTSIDNYSAARAFEGANRFTSWVAWFGAAVAIALAAVALSSAIAFVPTGEPSSVISLMGP